MLSVKQWKPGAILRLAASLFVSDYSGALALALLRRGGVAAKESLRLSTLATGAFICFGASLVLLWKPWQLETAMRRLTAFLLCFYAGIFLGAWVFKSAAPASPRSEEHTSE